MLENTTLSMMINTLHKQLEGKKYPSSLINYISLICYGTVINYGQNKIDEIIKVISSIEFIVSSDVFDSLLFNNSDECFESDAYNVVYSDFNNNLISKNTLFVKNKYLVNPNLRTLENMVFVINNFYNERNNNVMKCIDGTSCVNGLFTSNSKENKKIIYGIMNALQTENIIKNILRLKDCNIDNHNISLFIEDVCTVDYKNYSLANYNISMNLFRSLFKIIDIRKSLDENVVFLEKDLKSFLGNVSYDDFLRKLSILTNGFYNSTFSYYQLSLMYCDIRSVLDKYLSTKYNKKYA